MSPHVRQKSRTAGTNCTRSVQDREHAYHQKAILKETQRKTTLPVDITSSMQKDRSGPSNPPGYILWRIFIYIYPRENVVTQEKCMCKPCDIQLHAHLDSPCRTPLDPHSFT